jgi:dihydroorotate dehydrogenase (fumarate)
MGGTSLKIFALTNAEHFRELLPDHIGVIGVGGIRTGKDVADYLRFCTGVQVGTACFQNISILEKIAEQWLESSA